MWLFVQITLKKQVITSLQYWGYGKYMPLWPHGVDFQEEHLLTQLLLWNEKFYCSELINLVKLLSSIYRYWIKILHSSCVSFPAAWCAELIEFVWLFAHLGFFLAANFPIDVVDNLPAAVSTGIYYGWASVDRGPVYKMVMSIGWNPFYNNTKKSMVGTTANVCKWLLPVTELSNS